jgi:hypothetical protein
MFRNDNIDQQFTSFILTVETAIKEIAFQLQNIEKDVNVIKYEREKTQQLNWNLNKKIKELDDKILEINVKFGE